MFVTWLVACASCWERPSENDPEDRQDSPPTADSADTGDSGPVDSGPPPMCEFEWFETGDHATDYKDDVPVPMETWVCGYFDSNLDFERMLLDVPEDTWLRLEFEGEARGSSADGIMSVFPSVDDTDACTQYARPGSADPYLIFPVNQGGAWIAMLAEDEQGWGDDYPWWFRASSIKAPTHYDTTFTALAETYAATGRDGLTKETALPYVEGQVVFGQLDGDTPQWFRVEIPEGMNQIFIDSDAAVFGSHADTAIYIYEEDAQGRLAYDWMDVDEAGSESTDSSYYSYNSDVNENELGGHTDCEYDSSEGCSTDRVPAVAVVFGVLHTGTNCASQYVWYTVEADLYQQDPPEEK